MLKYNLNNEQYNVLAAMAYSIADIHHMKERYPAEDIEHELDRVRKNIESLITEADRLLIPYWLQNIVLVNYEDWRLVYKTDVKNYLQHKPGYNITFR